ncbi:alpha/beta fold hydrolase [Legionella quateirensis]|uniref:Lipolytic enzyme n=1 Tax=Legionella quateirensis TaxID=45072 RepID=A0A378KTR3_9GAMM|nr:alpha/beta hydrolase [Legionella quateirensis]KTD44616.1 lipolytic enzyme [Legionella quateirensis]STY16867.1 lipolytic protein [Legionella quateirensis]
MKKWFLGLCLIWMTTPFANSLPEFYGPLKHVTIGNSNIAYYRFGEGKPLVMITGHGDSMSMWHPEFLKRISKIRQIIMFDYPGIGESTTTGSYPNTMDQLSKLVQSFIESQKLDKPDMLGFSMGGSLLLYMTTQYGTQYDHIIVIGAKAGGKKTVAPEAMYFNMLADPHTSPAVEIKTLLFPADATKQADAYLNILSQFPPQKMNADALKAQAAAVTGENQGPGIWSLLPGIKNKVLVISGTDDVLSPVQNAVTIAAAIPGSWLVQVKDAGHGVLFQEPVFISELVEFFINN